MDTKKEDAIRQLKLLVGSLSSMHRIRSFLIEHPDCISEYINHLSASLDKEILDVLLSDDGRVLADILTNL